MSDFLGACFLVVGFLLGMRLLGLVGKATEVIRVSRMAVADLGNPELDDSAKELALQEHAKRLLVLFLLLSFGSFLSLALPLVFVWLLERLNVLRVRSVMATALSWEFVLFSTVILTAVAWLGRQARP